MNPKIAKPMPGRHLGWSTQDLETFPYARFWNPRMADLSATFLQAVANSPLSEDLLPPMSLAIKDIVGAPIQNGFTVTHDGAAHVNLLTELPGVTPAMIDWWFGWHSDSPERYKLWYPNAHVHASWQKSPPAGARGRARYVGNTSLVDEFIGANLGRFAISFRPPQDLGLDDPTVESGIDATAICASAGLVNLPIDAGFLVHLVTRTDTGSVMRSRFWMGAPYARARSRAFNALLPIARSKLRFSEAEARSVLVHCAQEMGHLGTFLPGIYEEFRDLP